jgi:hypothetical protein
MMEPMTIMVMMMTTMDQEMTKKMMEEKYLTIEQFLQEGTLVISAADTTIEKDYKRITTNETGGHSPNRM